MEWKASLVGKKHILSYTFIWFSDDVNLLLFHFVSYTLDISVFVVESLFWENMRSSGTEILRDRLIRQLKY